MGAGGMARNRAVYSWRTGGLATHKRFGLPFTRSFTTAGDLDGPQTSAGRLAADDTLPVLPRAREGDRLALRGLRLRGAPEGGGRAGRDHPQRADLRQR